MVLLELSDDVQFDVDKDIASCSVVLRNMLEDVGDVPDHTIPIHGISASTMTKVLEYCKHHRNDPPETEDEFDKKGIESLGEWDREFVNVEPDILFDILLAANYLDIRRLLDIGCITVAEMIRGKTTTELRSIFNIVNDFSAQEEARIRKENAWAENIYEHVPDAADGATGSAQ
ncbi:E3 ubiquitin ligase SCF complex, Skp subunit [Rickenella mellea]|uniref:E3 ubiquitin ligase complex SCF subunit n=1 Tax=Rickenella mellea TaxID=50990 RepID=A0A4Y7PVA6_9AGAM|nr:E3 ubiquitin ligase SCF complex, Skp subunit [Rickenella mellea]